MTTIEDAVEALGKLEACREVDIVQSFLEVLLAKIASVSIPTDVEGFILEGAMQKGFDLIDDDASVYVVGANDLIAYTKRQREAP